MFALPEYVAEMHRLGGVDLELVYRRGMGHAHIHKTATVRAPIELVFERITDHEAMGEWPGVSRCVLVKEADGDNRNGRGAVRAVTARGLTLHEEIVRFEPPNVMEYTITKGLPVKHIGRVELSSSGDDTLISWTVTMSSGWPFVAQLVGRMLGRGLDAASSHFKKHTETAAREHQRAG